MIDCLGVFVVVYDGFPIGVFDELARAKLFIINKIEITWGLSVAQELIFRQSEDLLTVTVLHRYLNQVFKIIFTGYNQ